MKKIEKVVYELAGEEITITVDSDHISNIYRNEKNNSYHIFNADGFLYLEVFGVREVYYSGFPTNEIDPLEDDLDVVEGLNF